MAKCELTISNYVTTDVEYGKLTSLVAEEYNEFYSAMNELHRLSDDDVYTTKLIDVIDALCDLIVVIHNVSNAMGIDLEPFFDEVHKKNMEKAGGPKRDDGKQLKPEGWTPPDHESILKCIIGVEIDKQYSYTSIDSFCKDEVNKHTFKDGDPWNPPGPIHDDGPSPTNKSCYNCISFIKDDCDDDPEQINGECEYYLSEEEYKNSDAYLSDQNYDIPLCPTKIKNLKNQSIFEKLAEATGKLVTEKNAAYGDSVRTSGKIMQLLYPEGIAFDQIPVALLTVRVLDKLSRIANDPSYGGEDPAQDITGYGLLLMELVKNGL